MQRRKWALVTGLMVLVACSEREPLTPLDDDVGSMLAARGGGKGPPDKGDGDPEFEITTTNFDFNVFAGISSAPDGQNVRILFTESVPRIWTPAGGFVALPTRFAPELYGVCCMNDKGQIAGTRSTGQPFPMDQQAVFWQSSTDLDFDLPTGAVGSEPKDINALGQVLGTATVWDSSVGGYRKHVVLWTVDAAGSVTTRDIHEETFAPLGSDQSTPGAINDRGQIVGQVLSLAEHAFLLDSDNGNVTFLDGLTSHRWVQPYDINSADPVQLVGSAVLDAAGDYRDERGLVWTIHRDGTVETVELPPASGFAWNQVLNINDAGQVSGTSYRWGGNSTGTLWTVAESQVTMTLALGPGAAGELDNSADLAGLIRVLGTTGKNEKMSQGGWSQRKILYEISLLP